MDVIAERTLTFVRGAIRTDAIVRVGRPVPDESGVDWLCPYEVEIEGKQKQFRMHGIDSMQALVLTLRILDVELEVRAKAHGGHLQWLEDVFTSILAQS